MDQESFRRILESQKAGGGSSRSNGTTSRGSLLAAAAKPYKVEAAQPAFKPRKVKETKDSKYRDRASERRQGEGNDFAHVEALLEDFEKQTKDAKSPEEIEEKRKYLGGDGEHSVLVKGLDFALLEQNRARTALVTDALDDDSLEKAFQGVSTSTTEKSSKKRSRADLLKELKEKRIASPGGEADAAGTTETAQEEARRLEEARQKGKFKPIGFKPIGEPEGKKKKKKVKRDGTADEERKKKKRKVELAAVEETNPAGEGQRPTSAQTSAPPPPEPEPVDNDFDIFADAGEYDGLELGDDDDEEEDPANRRNQKASMKEEEEEEGEFVPKQWIPVEDSGSILQRIHSEPPEPLASTKPEPDLEGAESEEEAPMRLVPLASSAVPSIKELLEMDRAATSSYKNKKRKDKKKAEQGDEPANKPTAEERAERDYKKLKAYTDKKAGAKP
ncbi:RED-like protein N-terminal region-domain-containing protein [Ephemerocybe angulata]|uniref:RED-like protein N-terminal region-domain-containing protein n=1 Tax=Ephemerocybe angulata TaxID=980116 RepID=A0A8H6IC84_9AGAR|nr:RED-like protein N-terminal region-domain-containing protein [Tulosesus angulatus]